MPAKMFLAPTIHLEKILTVNLGTAVDKFTPADIGKAVKLSGADTYVLCEAGDKVEGVVTSVEVGTRGGVTIGGIVRSGYVEVVSAAALAVGDVVVAAAQPALGTELPVKGGKGLQPLPVQKAGADPEGPFLMRVVGFGGAADGAAGNVCVAEFI